MRARVAQLEARVEELLALVAKQQARIAILEKVSGSGPGSPPQVPPAVAAEAERKPKGRPEGHPGTSWSVPTVEPEVVELRLACCPDCGGKLGGVIDVQEHTVVDVPGRVEPVVRKYRHERRYCARCQKTVRAPRAADEPPDGHFGLELQAKVAEWKTKLGLPFTKIQELLASQFGVAIHRSSLATMVQRMGRWLLPVQRRLLEDIRAAPVKHADETPWPVRGKNGWAWLFATQKISVFLMEPTRGAAVPRSAFRGHLPGTLVSDDYGVYLDLADDRQSCWAHALREADEAAAVSRTPMARQLRTALHEIFRDADLVALTLPTMTPQARGRAIAWIDRRLVNLCQRRSNVPEVEHLKKRLRRQRRALLTFLRRPGVEPTNNLGERKIRKLVLVRKVSGGSRSWDGARAHGTLAGCIDSLEHLGTSFIDLLRRHVIPTRNCDAYASIVPT